MKLERAIKKLLEMAGLSEVYVAPPSVTECAEPICVGRAVYDREAKLPGGDRGRATASVLVCRETDTAAQDAAFGCERALATAAWERVRDLKGGQIVACDVGSHAFEERDGSGRYVYEIALEFTIKRDRV